jgi:hypothetical protein
MNERLIEEATAIDAEGYRQLVSENKMLREALEETQRHLEEVKAILWEEIK